jgi:dihydroorotate dehydrogenase
VNVSSPNTPGLRTLQEKAELDGLLGRIAASRGELEQRHGRRVPLLLKIAPDLEPAQAGEIVDALRRHGFDGVIATNTSLSREGVESLPHAAEKGGLSGAPIRARATAVIAALAQELKGEMPIIGVGGILSGADAKEKRDAGAALVQLYTGLIYRGPRLIVECASALRSH